MPEFTCSFGDYTVSLRLLAENPRSRNDTGIVGYTVQNTGSQVIPADEFDLEFTLLSSGVTFVETGGDVYFETAYRQPLNPQASKYNPTGFDSRLRTRHESTTDPFEVSVRLLHETSEVSEFRFSSEE